jgi:hypothetical protein
MASNPDSDSTLLQDSVVGGNIHKGDIIHYHATSHAVSTIKQQKVNSVDETIQRSGMVFNAFIIILLIFAIIAFVISKNYNSKAWEESIKVSEPGCDSDCGDTHNRLSDQYVRDQIFWFWNVMLPSIALALVLIIYKWVKRSRS